MADLQLQLLLGGTAASPELLMQFPQKSCSCSIRPLISAIRDKAVAVSVAVSDPIREAVEQPLRFQSLFFPDTGAGAGAVNGFLCETRVFSSALRNGSYFDPGFQSTQPSYPASYTARFCSRS